jgi:predicted Zn finger-like uncharacterized protein
LKHTLQSATELWRTGNALTIAAQKRSLKMQFECPVCQASYNVPDERLPQTINRAACKKCGTTMVINKETGEIKTESSQEESPPELAITDTRVTDDVPSVLAMSAQSRGQRDYLAIGVVVVALFVLIAGGLYVALSVNKSLGKGPLKSITKFMDDITDFGKYLGGKPGKQKQLQSKKARKAKKYLRRGYEQYKNKRYKKAIAEYNKALQIDPGNPEAYFWRARCRLNTGRYDKAIADFNKAVKFDPNYSKAYDNLGWLYMKRGEFDKSIGFLNKSIKLKPDNGWAYYTRAHIRIEQGNVEKGLIDANKACKMGYQDGCKIYKEYKR